MKEQKQTQQFWFIELLAYWQGGVNSTDLVKQSGFSIKQAKYYFKTYQNTYPDNLFYNSSTKKYQITKYFNSELLKLDATEYLDWLHHSTFKSTNIQTHLSDLPSLLPARKVYPQTMRALVYGINNKKGVETHYHSLTHPVGKSRVVHPHTFVKTGLRWHLRGYCESSQDYRDFVLSRFGEDSYIDDTVSYKSKESDTGWNSTVAIILIPNPLLTIAQRQVIATDYCMTQQTLVLTRRAALVQYTLQEMQIDISQANNPNKQPLVIENYSDIKKWLFVN